MAGIELIGILRTILQFELSASRLLFSSAGVALIKTDNDTTGGRAVFLKRVVAFKASVKLIKCFLCLSLILNVPSDGIKTTKLFSI